MARPVANSIPTTPVTPKTMPIIASWLKDSSPGGGFGVFVEAAEVLKVGVPDAYNVGAGVIVGLAGEVDGVFGGDCPSALVVDATRALFELQ